jgi:predicted amidohydrolase
LDATVVGGSIILPENADGDDAPTFRPRDARLYNLAYTFAPDGRCLAVTRKVNLVPTLEDTLPLTAGRPENVAPIATECGPVGVMICYDGFAEPHTEREPHFRPLGGHLAAAGAELIAQPSANPWAWNERWVFCGPGEDQLRRDQWLAEGLFTQLRAMPGVRYAVNPQLVGDLLGTRFDGRSYIFGRDATGAPTIVAAASRDDLDPRSEEVVVARVAARRVDARAAATA